MRPMTLLRSEMTPEQLECFDLMCDAVGGEHHLSGSARTPEASTHTGIRVGGLCHNFATFDSDLLTRLVVLGHDRCIRVEVAFSSPRHAAFRLHKRKTREGCMSQRHPTIEDAVARIREQFGNPDDEATGGGETGGET